MIQEKSAEEIEEVVEGTIEKVVAEAGVEIQMRSLYLRRPLSHCEETRSHINGKWPFRAHQR